MQYVAGYPGLRGFGSSMTMTPAPAMTPAAAQAQAAFEFSKRFGHATPESLEEATWLSDRVAALKAITAPAPSGREAILEPMRPFSPPSTRIDPGPEYWPTILARRAPVLLVGGIVVLVAAAWLWPKRRSA